jgi:hypothetical protein
MDLNKKLELSKVIKSVASIYNKSLDIGAIEMMIDLFEGYELEKIKSAYKHFMSTAKASHFPMPGQIIEILNPSLSTEAKANQIARMIPEAILKFGYPNPTEAKAYIGEIGWQIVQSKGGWFDVCNYHGDVWDAGTFHAQARDSAKAIIEASALGLHRQAIGYSEKNQFAIENNSIKKLTASIQKDI